MIKTWKLKEGTQGPAAQTSEERAPAAGAAVSEVRCAEAGSTSGSKTAHRKEPLLPRWRSLDLARVPPTGTESPQKSLRSRQEGAGSVSPLQAFSPLHWTLLVEPNIKASCKAKMRFADASPPNHNTHCRGGGLEGDNFFLNFTGV